jgi:chromosome segregation ATPase
MKPAIILALLGCALARVAWAQQPARTDVPPPPPAGLTSPPPASGDVASEPEEPPSAASEAPATAPADTPAAQEKPAETESFDMHVHRLLNEFNERHEQRELEMASYNKASGTDPGLQRIADSRKVQVELKDELDREHSSEQLAKDYREQARDVLNKEQAVQEFIAKRSKTLDDLSRQNVTVNRPDLEVALANLAHQPDSPEVQAQIHDIERRLSETERLEKDLPPQQTRAQQESAGAAEELAQLKALEQFYEKESKAFAADARSARNNRLALADRLEYYLVRDQAEDVLEQGRKATHAVQHLAASPEVEKTLNRTGAGAKPPADGEQVKNCTEQSGDEKACHEQAPQAHSE